MLQAPHLHFVRGQLLIHCTYNLFEVSFHACLPGMICSSVFSTLPEELVLLLE